jgi:hypothetical protein
MDEVMSLPIVDCRFAIGIQFGGALAEEASELQKGTDSCWAQSAIDNRQLEISRLSYKPVAQGD